MNLFVTDECPYSSAYALPDKLVVKMPLENAQMLAANFSEKYLALGPLTKADGSCYSITHENHPCTKWGREREENTAWMITHGLAMCSEYHRRYGRIHACLQAHLDAKRWFKAYGSSTTRYVDHSPFARAMPDEFKNDSTISTPEAYRRYIHTKGYAVWKHNNEPSWWDAEKFRPARELYLEEKRLRQLQRKQNRLAKLNDQHHGVPSSV